MKALFNGVGTALITPFDKDGKIDIDTYNKLLTKQLVAGINALIVGGTTGEGAVLSLEEKELLINSTVQEIEKHSANDKSFKKPAVIVGIASNNPILAAQSCLRFSRLAIDGFLVTTPFYNKTSQRGLTEVFHYIADRSPKPIIVYNVPSRTGVEIQPETYGVIVEHPNIYGIKEAGTSLSRINESLLFIRNKCAVYSGCDELALSELSIGMSGWISVISNLFPNECLKLYDAFSHGWIEKAIKLNRRLYSYIKIAFSEVNPIPIKAMMSYKGLCGDTVRMPLVCFNDKENEVLKNAFEKADKFASSDYCSCNCDSCKCNNVDSERVWSFGEENEYHCSRR